MKKKPQASGSAEKALENRRKMEALATQSASAMQEAAANKKEAQKAEREKAKLAESREEIIAGNKKHLSKPRRVAIDLSSSLAANAWFESWNLGARYLAEWSEAEEGKKGFWRKNVDIAQSAPHILVGMATYAIEMATRTNQSEDANRPAEFPSWWREFLSDLGKTLTNLGFSNLARAIRFRYHESVDERVEKQDAIDQAADELAKLKADNDKLQALNAELQKRLGGSGGGATP